MIRPRFDSYKSVEVLKREQQLASQQKREQSLADRRSARQDTYGLILANLPLLEKYVEKSPVEVEYYSWFKSAFRLGLVGGWPVGTMYISARGDEHSTNSPQPARTDYLIVTEDKRFGYAIANKERNTFQVRNPLALSERNFIKYEVPAQPIAQDNVDVPSVDNIKSVLKELFTEVGIDPNFK